MRFLIDSALSPLVATRLKEAGHDATHVRDLGLQSAEDAVIFEEAALQDRVLVSADTDFGAFLAARETSKPSLILFRRPAQRRPEAQVALLLANLPSLEEHLTAGAVVVLEEGRMRIHLLPTGGGVSETN